MASQEVSIIVFNGKDAVTSLQLAKHFDIRHQHVLRDIRAVLRKIPDDWGLSNFGQSEYLNEQGKTQPCYLLTRDAFTLLAMGYNSVRAIEWKLKYIEAFNALERKWRSTIRLTTASRALTLTPQAKSHMMKVLGYRRRGFSYREIAKVMDIHQRAVGHLLKTARELGMGV